jgi:dipeptidyl-peptidase-4
MKKSVSVLALFICLNAFSQLTLDKIWNSREYNPRFTQGFMHLNDGVSYCQLDENTDKSRSCNKYDIKTGNKLSTIFSTDKILVDKQPINIESYNFSADETKVLFTNVFEAVYRHSGKSNTYVYDLSTSKLQKISDKKIMYATLSPDGLKVAYVSDNNLYYFDLVKGKEKQVTNDGVKNEVINGAVDWVYEEEFSMSRGFEWSPDGTYLAYYKFDESKVPQFSMDIFGKLYPERETWKYPKAGEVNSKVDVYIHKLGSKKNVLCETGSQNDQYLPRIKWISENYLGVQRLNRLQNKLELLSFSYDYTKADVLYTETNSKYLDINDMEFNITVSKGPAGETIVNKQVYFMSEKSGYNHLWRLNITERTSKSGKIERTAPVEEQITSGNWEIDQPIGIDKKNNVAYFTSGKNNPSERQLYSVNLGTKELKQITTEQGWHTVSFTYTFEYFTDQYSTMAAPAITVIKDRQGNVVRMLENNQALKDKLATLNLGQVEFGSFNSSENVKLDYWKITPPDFDPNKKYPVLFFVYGGPGYQTVKNQWGGAQYLWYQYMAQKGYVIISVDNRGSGGRGEAFKKITYLNLGKYETMDYIEAAKYFGAQPYVDKTRIGIFGWSYGGFMASSCITIGADYFKTAVAVAPVTNWRFYDNIYTERYMRKPQENAAGYDNNSPINHVDKIKGNYLIIHGTADDNVHFQNAAEMVKKMNDNNIPYDAEYYPNTNHGIRGGKTRLHLFSKISGFILTNL